MSPRLQTSLTSISRRFRRCRAFLATCLIALASASAHAQTTLHVAAAADLGPVLPPILADFEQQSGIKTLATYQASATLATQIRNGAPFDLFLSADLSYPQSLIDAHLAAGSKPTLYARGNLVLWCPKTSPLSPPSLALLSNASLQRLVIANPDRAPYGRAAVAVLNQLHLYDALKPKLVIAENISQAAQFVESGNADAGFISLTAALTPQLAQHGAYITIPLNLYPPIEQGAVILNSSTQTRSAQQLLDYLLSSPVQQRLQAAGLSAFDSATGNKSK